MAKGKIIFIFSVLAAMTLLFTASCSGPKHPKEIAMLDSLRVKLDSSEAALISIDSAKVTSAIEEVNIDLHEITVRFSKVTKDTVLNREAATNMTKYRSVRKAFNAYKKEHVKLLKDIDYSQAQITNLIHDLEKNMIEEKDVLPFVEKERSEAMKTIQKTGMMVAAVKEMLNRYDETRPKVKEYIEGLRADEKGSNKRTK
jgi:predicted  nucleic acid-binding Zn-ribbon protein